MILAADLAWCAWALQRWPHLSPWFAATTGGAWSTNLAGDIDVVRRFAAVDGLG